MLGALFPPVTNELRALLVSIAVPDAVTSHDYEIMLRLDGHLLHVGEGRNLVLLGLLDIPVRSTLLLWLGRCCCFLLGRLTLCLELL